MKVFKNKKQRIVAVFLSLVFAFMLVPFTDVYASTPHFAVQGSKYVINHYDNGELDLNLEYTFSSCDSDIIFISKCYLNSDGSTLYSNNVVACSLSAFFVEFESSTNRSNKNESVYENGLYLYNMTNSYINGGSYPTDHSSLFSAPPISSYYVFSNDDILKLLGGDDTGFDYSNADSTSEGYSSEIGALKNVSRNVLYPNGANNTDSVFWHFMYSSKTTKGYSVKTSGTKIRVYESVTYYKRSDDSVYSEGPKVLVGEYDATGLQFDMDVNEAFNKTTSETESDYIASAWTIVSKQIVRNDRIYLQVVDSDGNYGDYLRIGGQSDNGDKNPQDVVDEDGNIISDDNGGYSTDDTDEKIGVDDNGDMDSANDDANSKPDPTISIGGDLDSAVSTFSDMLGMIGNIPLIIQKVFSFLPDWCLGFIGTFFVALCVLIIYKLVRG